MNKTATSRALDILTDGTEFEECRESDDFARLANGRMQVFCHDRCGQIVFEFLRRKNV